MTTDLQRAQTVEHEREVQDARLIVLSGAQAGRRCALPRRSILGRHADSPIVLEDPGVSRKHIEIRRRDTGGWELDDLHSRNGVRVNGLPAKRVRLSSGDRIQLGPTTVLLFTDRSAVEEELLERQKFELLGRLAVGVAHDFNNVLGVLAASSAYLRRMGADIAIAPAELDACTSDIDAAVANGARLANRLVGFARGSHRGRVAVDVSRVCCEIAQMCRRLLTTSVELRVAVDGDLHVIADEGELEQVLMNLCVNARDAMPNGGTLTLRASRQLLGEQEQRKLGLSGPQIMITVADTGLGIEPLHLSKLFEAFFTTKPPGVGFGVGLATVKELVASYGGAITVDSTLGRGSAFSVYLPASGQPVRRTPTEIEKRGPSLQGEGRRVLLVDDDELVRRSAKRLLSRLGFDVTEADNGSSALVLYAAGPRPDVVMLDLEMPGMGGVEVLRELRARDPDAVVLVVSGHRDATKAQAVSSLGGRFLGKPFNAEELAAAIESVTNHDDPLIETKRHRLAVAAD